MEKDYDMFYIMLIFFFSILVIASASYFMYHPKVTGMIVASGGTVTQATITGYLRPSMWIGITGNVTGDMASVSNSTFFGGDVGSLTIFGNVSQTNVIISTVPAFDPANLTPASHADIDLFMGVGPGTPLSSNSTYRLSHAFTVYNATYVVPALQTSSQAGEYLTGVLKGSGGLIFVSTLTQGFGFDGKPVDFQAVLPVPASGNITYFFTTEGAGNMSGGLDCNVTLDPVAWYNATSGSIHLDWSDVPGATGYEVEIINDSSSLDFSAAREVLAAASAWEDTSLGFMTRHYRIVAVSGPDRCASSEILGARNQTLVSLPGNEYNMVSFPFVFADATVGRVLESISGTYSRVYEFNNTRKQYAIFITGVWDDIKDLKHSRAYWISVTSNVSLITAGRVVGNASIPLTTEYNMVGLPDQAGNRSIDAALQSISGDYQRIYEFNNTNKGYNIFIAGVWNAIGEFQPGLGYWVSVTDNVTAEVGP